MLSTQEHINFMQRKIIVNSYIYYELSDNVVTDKEYDDWCKELVKYKNEYPDLWKKSEYRKQFGDDYDGSTGYYLWHKLSKSQKRTIRVIASMRHRVGGG